MNLRLRFVLASTLGMALVSTLAAVAIYSAIGHELRGQTVDTMRSLARAQSTFPGTSLDLPRYRNGDHDSDRPPTDGPLGGPVGYYQFISPDGNVQRYSGDTSALPVTRADRRIARRGTGESINDDIRIDGEHLVVLTIGQGPDGAIQVARSLREVDRVLARAARVLELVTLLAIAIAIVLGLLIARVALRPVAEFTGQAERLAADPGKRGRLAVDGDDEVSRLAASFNRTLDALEASITQQQQLVADAGHELRTPIASIRANVQVLEDADRLPPDELTALRRDIVTELDELTELLSDVIELARATDPDSPVDDVRLDEVVRAASERARRRGDSEVSLDLDVEPTVVRGDAARIGRAVSNVVDNARKWSPPGGRIHVTLRDGVVRVRDEGPGFPPQSFQHVFDRFWRAPDARSMPGSGLGLAIVRHAAEESGGWVRASNAADGGAYVDICFGDHTPPESA